MPPSFLFVLKKQQEILVSLCFPWHKEFTENRKNCELQGGSLAPLFCTLKVSKLFGNCCHL
jgi:hypothetical protein